MPYKDPERQRELNRVSSREWHKRHSGSAFNPDDPSFLLERLIKESRKRAKKKDLPYDLTIEWAMDLYEKACPMSSLPYAPSDIPGRPGPRLPSIDRIDPALGYIQSNCRLVCTQANYALNVWGDEVLKEFCRGVAETAPAKDASDTSLPPFS